MSIVPPYRLALVGSGQQATRLRERGEQPRKAGKAAFPSRSFANEAQSKRVAPELQEHHHPLPADAQEHAGDEAMVA